MKRMAILVVLMMILSQISGFAYPTTVDNMLDGKSKSDIRPVQDTAKIAGALNDGVNKAFKVEPLSTIDKVRVETYKGAKKVINVMWDSMTLKSLREKSEKKAE